MPYVSYLKELKKKRNLTVAEIAELSKIPSSTISRILNGNTADARFETVAPIVVAMGGSLDEMVGLKSPDEEPVKPQVETTLTAYADLLNEKDLRIKEKDEIIKSLNDDLRRERKDVKRLMITALVLTLTMVVLALIDLTNSHLGFF